MAVAPREGSALVFWSVAADGTPDPAMWHAGCIARSGGGRWALQKFKQPLPGAASTATLEHRRATDSPDPCFRCGGRSG